MHPEHGLEVAHLELTHERMTRIMDNTKCELQDSQTRVEGLKKSSGGYDDALQVALNVNRSLEQYYRELWAAKKRPYFGRINFLRDGEQNEHAYYIGKVGLFDQVAGNPYVVDWRAAIASLYYGGELGEVMYLAPEGPVFGKMDLKRQYQIEEGQLIDVFDKNIAPVDEFLNLALSQSKDNRLADIVSTIQSEQNAIIREHKDKFTLVQGVAGSGKTTIVLHRIAYLLYNYQDLLKPEQVLMLMPNKLFLDYVSEVLPDLGVDQIEQLTFLELAMKLQKRVTFEADKWVEKIYEDAKGLNDLAQLTTLKGETFKVHLDDCINLQAQFYVEAIQRVAEAFKFDASLYLKAFNEDYVYLPLFKRLPKVVDLFERDIQARWEKYHGQQKGKVLKEVQNLPPEAPERRTLFDQLEQKLEENRLKLDQKWDALRQTLEPKSVIGVLDEALESFKAFEGLSGNHRLIHVKENRVDEVLCGQFLYLIMSLEGLEDVHHYAHIVVDEAQDYNLFQFRILQKINRANVFTIVGDVNQGIRQYKGLDGWHELHELAPTYKRAYHEILTCYRSTVQIVNAANECLLALPDSMRTALPRPVLRQGEAPIYDQGKGRGIEEVILKIVDLLDQWNHFHSIAILTPNENWSLNIFEHLNADHHKSRLTKGLHRVDEATLRYEGGISIMPIYQAKGLEFDAVILLDGHVDSEMPLHHKMKYVAMTRALHQIALIEV